MINVATRTSHSNACSKMAHAVRHCSRARRLVLREAISGKAVTAPATSEEAQEAVAEWNARCVTRQVEPPIKVDGWGPAGELRAWLLADDGWWGLVAGRNGVQWMRAEDVRQSRS